jgi:hypothetical protein
MPFVVENGTGLEDARSYASVQDLRDFAEFRVGVTLPDDDVTCEKALVTASEWIDSNFANRFRGARAFVQQRMEFPRSGYIDINGQAIQAAMPIQLSKATCLLAIEAAKGNPLYNNADGSKGAVIEDSVGPLITKYAPGNPATLTQERQFPEVQATLAPLLRGFGMLTVCR